MGLAVTRLSANPPRSSTQPMAMQAPTFSPVNGRVPLVALVAEVVELVVVLELLMLAGGVGDRLEVGVVLGGAVVLDVVLDLALFFPARGAPTAGPVVVLLSGSTYWLSPAEGFGPFPNAAGPIVRAVRPRSSRQASSEMKRRIVRIQSVRRSSPGAASAAPRRTGPQRIVARRTSAAAPNGSAPLPGSAAYFTTNPPPPGEGEPGMAPPIPAAPARALGKCRPSGFSAIIVEAQLGSV